MCGIVGIYNFNEEIPVDTGLLLEMRESLRHRGPDDGGMHVSKNMGIGARRLSIIGVETGRQPIANEDGTIWVALNGEIYNYRELRDSLLARGHKFRTEADTECIVHLYEEVGERCVDQLRGMFAFVVMDTRTNRLLIARDRLGIKPLFYSVTRDRIIVGSEIKAILQDKSLPRAVDLCALDAYFTFTYVPSPLTIFKGIRKLDAGHYISCDAKGIRTEKYWDFNFVPDTRKTEEEFAEEFNHLFSEVVRMHLASDVPLGAFLSGGIDSGLVVAMMARHMSSPVETFTVGFGGSRGSPVDERPYARQVGERYGTRYHEIEVQPKVEDIIDSIACSFDEPFADDSVFPTYYICKIARQHVTVVLSGLGGDELFGGYERYLGLSLSRLYNHVPALVKNGIIEPLVTSIGDQYEGSDVVQLIKRFIRADDIRPGARYLKYVSAIDEAGKDQLYSSELRRAIQRERTTELGTRYFNAHNAESVIDQALYQDFKMYLPDDILALSDRLSMHHSLELRVPFVDHKLVEFCATIPSRMKIRLFSKKYLMKVIAKPLLPASVLRHRKIGFAAPMGSWLRNELKNYTMELLCAESVGKDGWFRPEYIKRVVTEHMERRESHTKLIFGLMMFQKWFRTYC